MIDTPDELQAIKARIFQCPSADFESLALRLFRVQARANPVYGQWIQLLGIKTGAVGSIEQIPFLPVALFKSHRVLTGHRPVEQTFESSGTTGATASKHHLPDLRLYEQSFVQGFERIYGPLKNYCILALLPSYLERANASLVYMVKGWIDESGHPENGFFLNDQNQLAATLQRLDGARQRVLLIGVSFALWELAERHPMPLRNTVIMETGGMKGRRKELIREELHGILKRAFQVDRIHSEYGMTELLSQAYSKGNGQFHAPPWMRVLIRDAYDPLALLGDGETGCLNLIDLANLYSCAFIATDDLGRTHGDGRFEVLGRLDASEVRGCNLMAW